MNKAMEKHLQGLVKGLKKLKVDEQVAALNAIREALHEAGPFAGEPVDCVRWIKFDDVAGNPYNPNKVAPPEMELLRVSIQSDGYTQPIVAWPQGDGYEVVDGFHRHRVGKECLDVQARIHGYLPISAIRKDRQKKSDRIAATIRHNRARGKHQISAMSDIVLELKNRNWTDQRISRELGMDEDEILRLCQITGLAEAFKDEDFSRAWEIDDSEAEFTPLTDEIDVEEREAKGFRTVNTSDPNRVFHTYDKWECHKYGFYEPSKPGLKREEAEALYAKFLADDSAFRAALEVVTTEWVNSCEHYLTNAAMNRIAWLGQAAACYAEGLPSVYCGGFNLLTPEQQDRANRTALDYLNRWLISREMEPVDLDAALTGRQSTLY